MPRNPELEWLKRENLWLRRQVQEEKERYERLVYSLCDKFFANPHQSQGFSYFSSPFSSPSTPSADSAVGSLTIEDLGKLFKEDEEEVEKFRNKLTQGFSIGEGKKEES